MKKKGDKQNKAAKLRSKAEKKLDLMLTNLDQMPQEDVMNIKQLIHELRVHQIELEMQNDELRKVQQEIEVSRKKYFDLYNFAPVGYFTFDKEGQVLEVNLHASQIFGVDRRSFLNSNFYSYILHDDCDLFYWHLAKVCETRTRHSCEIRMLRKDKTQFYAHIESIVTEDDNGDSPQCKTAIFDITDLKQAEAALRESEEKYRRLIENSNDAIYILHGSRFEMINKKFMEIFKVTLDEVNKPEFDFLDLVAPKSRQLVKERMKSLARGEELEPRYEFTALNKDGREFEVEVCVSYIKYNGGGAIQGILRDISGRKSLEEQLRQAQKMEAIGKLAGGIAHDFNNLLTAIIGNAELIRVNMDPHAQRLEEVEEIEKAANRAALLTKQLLAFARKQPLILKVINLNKIINSMKNMLKRLIGENIQLIIELEPTLDYIKADSGQISQLIMNLIINAKEAITEQGIITVKTENINIDKNNIKLFPYAKPGKYVSLSILDSGVGIEEIIMDQLFEPFFTTKGLANSSGLGLSVVYGVVKQHEGWINVSSEKKQGAEFLIFLPVTSELPLEKTGESISITEFAGRGKRILLVEDEEIVRKYIVKLLQSNSYVVCEASNANEAIRIFKEEDAKFDLIFSDIILPDMTGIKLVDKLLSYHRQIPILFGSGYADHESEWPIIQEKGYRFIANHTHFLNFFS